MKKIVMLTAALTLAGSGAAFAGTMAKHPHHGNRVTTKDAPSKPSTSVKPATK